MSEKQAKAMLRLWKSLGYSGTAQDTGGGVWYVYLENSSGRGVTAIGIDGIASYPSEYAMVNGVDPSGIVNL